MQTYLYLGVPELASMCCKAPGIRRALRWYGTDNSNKDGSIVSAADRISAVAWGADKRGEGIEVSEKSMQNSTNVREVRTKSWEVGVRNWLLSTGVSPSKHFCRGARCGLLTSATNFAATAIMKHLTFFVSFFPLFLFYSLSVWPLIPMLSLSVAVMLI